MRTSVIINNYNYGHFIVEAIDSVLRQTTPPDEIIIVDDGSTDGSVARLTAAFRDHPHVRIIGQANGGMLSTHNRGFEASTGDILFFLDADDLYAPRRIEAALAVFRARPEIGLVFCPLHVFGKADGFMFVWENREGWTNAPETRPPPQRDVSFGCVLCDMYLLRRFIGSATSSLAIRRAVLAQFMPLALENQWRNNSDICLLYGSAMAGAHFYYMAEDLVRYRTHGNNQYWGQERSREETADFERRSMALMDFLVAKMEVPVRGHPAILGEVSRKLASSAVPWKECRRYMRRLGSFGVDPVAGAAWRIRWLFAFLQGRMCHGFLLSI